MFQMELLTNVQVASFFDVSDHTELSDKGNFWSDFDLSRTFLSMFQIFLFSGKIHKKQPLINFAQFRYCFNVKMQAI